MAATLPCGADEMPEANAKAEMASGAPIEHCLACGTSRDSSSPPPLRYRPVRLGLLILALPSALLAQRDSLALSGLHWRELGPYRGGRAVAATGNPSRPNEFWMGTTGGGVFKSINAGQSWAPVTDNYFGGTIGAVAVAPSAPDVVYVGDRKSVV